MFLLIVGCVTTCSSQDSKLDLRKVVGLAAENGTVAIQKDVISIFSQGNIRLEGPSGWTVQRQNAGVISLRISGLSWERENNGLNPSMAHGPLLCDPLNQINIASTLGPLPLALPDGARVKSVLEFPNFSIVVYAISASTVRYDVRIALLQHIGVDHYVLVKAETPSENGTFCGIQNLGQNHFLLFADEPSGSSDFLALYLYAVKD
jgi:hypothetical protein